MAGTSAGARKGMMTRIKRLEGQLYRLSLREEARAQKGSERVSGLNVSLNTIDEEYVPALRRLSGRLAIFDQMANDPNIKAQLRANIFPLLSAVRWKFEGGREEIREFLSANLLREGPRKWWCSTSWKQRLFEKLQCLKYGVSILAKTRAVVDGKMIFAHLKWIHPRSLDDDPWIPEPSDPDRLKAVRRTYRTLSGEIHTREEIPAGDLFILPWECAGPNWEGCALIRPMYRAWKEKDLASKIDMIDLQTRGVGIPDAEMAEKDGPKDRDNLLSIALSLRGGSKERQAIVRKPGQKVGYLTTTGTVKEAEPIIRMKNMEFATGGSTEFMSQGQTETGSRATSSVQLVQYLQMLDAVKAWIEEAVNFGIGDQLGLVEELVIDNFEISDEEEIPRLTGSKVSPTEQLDNIPLIKDLVQAGAIKPTLDLENEIRKRLGWPEISQEEFNQAQPVRQIGGRPDKVTPIDREEPREDKLSRVGLVEKKTPDGGILPTSRSVSWPWVG